MLLPQKYEIQPFKKSRTLLILGQILNEWRKLITELAEFICTHWIYRSSIPNGKCIVCSKQFVCPHSYFKKPEINKKGLSKYANCPATIDTTIKRNMTAAKDPFMKWKLDNAEHLNNGVHLSWRL